MTTTPHSVASAPTAAPAPMPPAGASAPVLENDRVQEVRQLLATLFGGSPAATFAPTSAPATAPAPAPYAGAPAAAPAAAPAPAPAPPAPVAPRNEFECLATMQAHREHLPDEMTNEDLANLAADESKPPELRKAAEYMINRGMVDRLGHEDGNISGKDWENISNKNPELAELNRAKTRTYTENYIPSDPTKGDSLPRPITANDASRELYLYSDSLPEEIGPEQLQDIVDGRCSKKCPPQLRAAAQYLLDNPGEWEKLAPKGKIGRGDLQNSTSANINLRKEEMSAITTVQQNKDLFLRDGMMTRESLTALAADETAPPEVRAAAQHMLGNALVFGMIENAKKDHSGKHAVNDGKASADDIDALATRLTTNNRTPPGKPVGQHAPTTAAQKAAVADMLAGCDNDPEIKKVVPKKKSPWAKVLDIAGKVLDGVKMAVDAVSGFLPPPANFVGIAVGATIGAVNDLAIKPAAAILNGASPKDAYKQAGKDFAMDMAGSAISLIPGGGVARAGMAAGKIGMTAAKAGAKEGAEAVAKEGTEVAVKEGAKTGAREGAEAAVGKGSEAGAEAGARKGGEGGAREGSEAGARKGGEGGEAGAREGAEQGAKPTMRERAMDAGREVRDTAVDEGKGEAQSRAEAEAEKRWNQQQEKRRAQAQAHADAGAGG